MTVAVTTDESQLPTEAGITASVVARESQLPTEVGMTTTATTTFESQLPTELGWNATGLNTTFFSQLPVEVAFRGRPQQREMHAWTFNLDGHSFYVLQLGDDEGTIVYDQTTKMWAEWQSVTDDLTDAPFRGRCGLNWDSVDTVVGDDNLGLIWNITTDLYQDEAPNEGYLNTSVNSIVTGGVPQHLHNSTQCNGVLLSFSAASSPAGTEITLSTSDDQGVTYDNQGSVATTNDSLQFIQWMSLGSISQPLRIFQFSDNGIARINSADMW